MRRLFVGLRDRVLVALNADGEWNVTVTHQGIRPEALGVGSDQPRRVFLGTFDAGLHRSEDAGDTFERIGTETIESSRVTAVAVSPHDPAVVWAGTEPSALYRSFDGGETWEHLPSMTDVSSVDEWAFPPRPDTHHVRWIEPDSKDPDRVYVGIEAGAILRTTDGGASWEDRPPGSRRDNHTLATHPEAPDRVYAAAGDGYAESADGGATWTHPEDGLQHRYVWGLAVDPGDPERVIVSAAKSANRAHREPARSFLYRKSPTGWDRLDDIAVPTGDGAHRAVVAAGVEAGEFVAAADDGCYRTVDGGDTWRRMSFAWPDTAAAIPTRAVALVRHPV